MVPPNSVAPPVPPPSTPRPGSHVPPPLLQIGAGTGGTEVDIVEVDGYEADSPEPIEDEYAGLQGALIP
eukprot:11807347-Alexandrium_andersonii.AAC.1